MNAMKVDRLYYVESGYFSANLFGIVGPFSDFFIVLHLRNNGTNALGKLKGKLQQNHALGITVPLNTASFEHSLPNKTVMGMFRVETNNTPVGVHHLTLSVSGDGFQQDIAVPINVAAVYLEDSSLDENGKLTFARITANTSDGKMTAVYQRFLEGRFPLHTELTFTPNQPFIGVHPPLLFNGTADIERKLIAALVSGFGVGALVDVAGEIAVAKILALAAKRGLTFVVEKLAPYFLPGVGYIALTAAVCAAGYDAYKAGRVGQDGDVFWFGEQHTIPPRDAVTTSERVVIEVVETNAPQSCAPQEGLIAPLHVSANVAFTRTIETDGARQDMTFCMPLEETDDWRLPLEAHTDKSTYSAGEEIIISATAALPDHTQLKHGDAWVHAAIFEESGELVTPRIPLFDHAGAGVYTGAYKITDAHRFSRPSWIVHVRAESGLPLEIPFLSSRILRLPVKVAFDHC